MVLFSENTINIVPEKCYCHFMVFPYFKNALIMMLK